MNKYVYAIGVRIKRYWIKFLEWPYKQKLKKTIKDDIYEEHGGYAVVNDIPDHGVVFSFGIGDDVDFEEYIISRYPSVQLYAFDPTPTTIEYMKSKPKIKYYPIGLSDHDGNDTFYKDKAPNGVCVTITENVPLGISREFTLPVKTMKSLMKYVGVEKVDLLKMDIEGSEFIAIPQMFSCGIYPDQICVELHERFYSAPVRKLDEFIKYMESNGYSIAHTSSVVEEFTFRRMNKV